MLRSESAAERNFAGWAKEYTPQPNKGEVRVPMDAGETRGLFLAIWRAIVAEAKEDGWDLVNEPMTVGAMRMSVEWIRSAYYDKFTPTLQEFLDRTFCFFDDYQIWEKSKLGQFCRRMEKAISRKQIEGQIRSVKNVLAEDVKNNGDKVSAKILLQTTGQLNGETDNRTGMKVDFVTEYILPEGGQPPVEAKETVSVPPPKPFAPPADYLAIQRLQAQRKDKSVKSFATPEEFLHKTTKGEDDGINWPMTAKLEAQKEKSGE